MQLKNQSSNISVSVEYRIIKIKTAIPLFRGITSVLMITSMWSQCLCMDREVSDVSSCKGLMIMLWVLCHQWEQGFHSFNLQTWTWPATFSLLASPSSLAFLFPSTSLNIQPGLAMVLSTLGLDGYATKPKLSTLDPFQCSSCQIPFLILIGGTHGLFSCAVNLKP